jgi:hypothetical protein
MDGLIFSSDLVSSLSSSPALSPRARRFRPRATKKVQVAASALVAGPAYCERGLSPRLAIYQLYIQAMEAC